MENKQSLNHTKWECKYHLVWTGIPQIDWRGGMGKVGGRRESGNGGKWSKERG